MSDKKKKIISQREAIPKRPVILKSDRESKEPPKEKQEKEKQPTIILKTREQSAAKDERPSSPKPQTSTSETGQPNKIAQNEHKEKKIEQKPIQVKQMVEPVKLLDENLEFHNAALEFLLDSNTSYLVVGVIGLHGVGKSMILNLLAHNKEIPDLCSKILNSHDLSEDQILGLQGLGHEMENLNLVDTTEKDKKSKIDSDRYSFCKFKIQDIENIEKGVHCTRGVDMYVTEDRVILLDCQALWSSCLLDESIITMTPRSGNSVTVDCLQVASFLMAICHTLIAVQDWFTDYNFIRYIQTAEMLRPSLSASSQASSLEGEGTSSGESHPHLLLLHNRCQLEDFTVEAVSTMQELYRKAFQRSNLQLHSGMYLYSDTNKNGLNVDSVCQNYSVDKCGAPINMFLLPEIYDDYDNRDVYQGHPSFERLAKRLRWIILGANRHQITNVPNLSEKGWFQYCAKAWENIRKCTFFMEYERFLP